MPWAVRRSSGSLSTERSKPGVAIHARQIVKEFRAEKGRTVRALDCVDLDVRPSTFVAIVGPSGCGKTTLLRILADLERPTSGTVQVGNDSAVQTRRSMVFQGQSIFPWMTVWDNAAYGLKNRRVPRSKIKDQVDYYLDKTGLTAFKDAYPHQLSGGMQQRVSLCRAFANEPDLLLMDEPFSALDEQTKLVLQEELLRIWQGTGKTVVFITHSVDEAVTLADVVMVMSSRPGRFKAIMDVPFDRPRDVLELRRQPEYGSFVYEIWGLLRAESRQLVEVEEP
jgi:NitT/TauT family transport system ATP-binding protein